MYSKPWSSSTLRNTRVGNTRSIPCGYWIKIGQTNTDAVPGIWLLNVELFSKELLVLSRKLGIGRIELRNSTGENNVKCWVEKYLAIIPQKIVWEHIG